MAFVPIAMCATYRVTQNGRDPYEVTTELVDTLKFEGRNGHSPMSKDKKGETRTYSDMLWLVWHASRRTGLSSETSAVSWAAQVTALDEVVEDEADEADATADEDEDGLDDFGPYLDETDPTQPEPSTV